MGIIIAQKRVHGLQIRMNKSSKLLQQFHAKYNKTDNPY